MTNLHFASASELAGRVRRGEISARDLLEHFLARVDRINPEYNIIVVDDRERARTRADALDKARKDGAKLGPLHGVPMTVKESYNIKGLRTCWGIPELKDNVASKNALAVERLTAAGANIFGKTNIPIRLADFQSYNAVYGTTGNPWDKTRTPGGSSGGSSAALAAGITGLEIGSDIGGSIRNPAHFCGVFGHKPTWSLLPMRGHSLFDTYAMPDISVIGPLARSATDLETVLDLLAVPDELKSRFGAPELPGLDTPLSDLRIAIWESESYCPTSAGVSACIAALCDVLGKAGAKVDTKARPDFVPEHSHRVYQALLLSAMAARLPEEEFQRLKARAASLSPDDQSDGANTVRAQTLHLREWLMFAEERAKIRWAWNRFFCEYDFMITPIMPTTAFPHDHSPEGSRKLTVDGKAIPYFNQTFWAGLASGAYLPATVIPIGPAADGLPVGVQIIGPSYGDRRTIQLAQRLEQLGFAFKAPKHLD